MDTKKPRTYRTGPHHAEVQSDGSNSLQNPGYEGANRPPSLIGEKSEILVEDASIAIQEVLDFPAVLFESQHPRHESCGMGG
jgi:hypothetical protein